MGEVVEFPASAIRVRCPDCRGRGCKWCDHTGRWLDVTAASAAAVARVLAAAGDRARSAEYREAAAALARRGPER